MDFDILALEKTISDLHDITDDFNDKLKEYLERIENEMKIPRRVHTLINNSIASHLMRFVSENSLEEDCCYFVKNVSPDSNICFVHKFSETGKSFQNLDLSLLPADVQKEDVIVLNEGKYVKRNDVTNEVCEIKERILKSLENSLVSFQEEGKEYFVCDKSDDVLKPKMSLRIEETMEEFWGIDIDAELYNSIKYGSKVRFESGKYVLVQ